MKIFTILIFTLLTFCGKAQFFFHLIPEGVSAKLVSDVKNIQPIAEDNIYEAFGFLVQNGPNQVSYYYSRATTHTTGGVLSYRKFNITARVWSSPVTIKQDSIHINGATGLQMDNDSTVIFYTSIHTDGSRNIYIIKGDSNNHFSNPVDFNWTGIEDLGAGFFFGRMVKGDVAGTYYHFLYQIAGSRFKVSCIKTTDYWNTYSEAGVVYDGTTQYTEPSGSNLGNGKFMVLLRNNQSGSLTPFESTNSGVNWTQRVSSNLYWFNGGGPEIPNVYLHPNLDSFDVFFECRDASMMEISKGNTVANNFGNATPIYNDQEIYAYNFGTGGNPSLGYGSQIRFRNSNLNLMVYSKQYTNTKANIQWTVDDLTTDPNGIPVVPTVTGSTLTATTMRYDVDNYDTTQWQNVRYLSVDLSTHADFSDFVTCKYRNISAYPAVPIQNIRMTAYYIPFSSLTTGTTYYFRIKACNNAGCSAYTTESFTTP